MLARPIIVLSEDVVRNKHGEAISYNDLYGIYLPMFSNPKVCHPEPLVIGYDQSHFCPLLMTDAKTGASDDTYLPLHQSVDLARAKTLLPVRFLGNDLSTEKTNEVLKAYLSIKRFAHIPENTNEQVPITCVELGNRFLFSKNNFLNLYYDYLVDFDLALQQQKEELDLISERRQKQRPSDDDTPNEIISNGLNGVRISDRSNTNTPPPPYAGHEVRAGGSPLERRSSYNQAVNGGESSIIPDHSPRRSAQTHERSSTPKTSQQIRAAQPRPLPPDPPAENHSSEQRSSWEHPSSTNGGDPNGKETSTNKNNSTPPTKESKVKQGKRLIDFHWARH